MITVKEASSRLHISTEECRRWIRAGVLPGVKVGSRWMVDESDLSHAAQHAEEYGIASNWLETFDKLTVDLLIILQAIDRDGGFDELLRQWPPQAQAQFLLRFDGFVTHMQALAHRAHAAAEVITIESQLCPHTKADAIDLTPEGRQRVVQLTGSCE
jgi:excisionase family DNA binding protein